MDGTIIQQGRFVNTGALFEAVEIEVRSDIDWMSVINYTVAGLSELPLVGVEYYWQRGMEADTGIEYRKSAGGGASADNLIKTMLTGGFTLLDTSGSPLTPLNTTITAISNDAIPVVTNSGLNGLAANDVVRLVNVLGAQQVGGFDFTVGNNTLTDTTFSLDFMSQIVAGTTGGWRRIDFDPQFYPRRRFATKITKASSAVITMSVIHGFTAGQAVRLIVPASFGMIQMNQLIGNITAIDTVNNTITVDIDSTTFDTFAWPLTAAVPFTPALVVPLGETANETFANDLSDATDNQSFIGMRLAGGPDSPGGAPGQQIYWRAGKSFSVTNNA